MKRALLIALLALAGCSDSEPATAVRDTNVTFVIPTTEVSPSDAGRTDTPLPVGPGADITASPEVDAALPLADVPASDGSEPLDTPSVFDATAPDAGAPDAVTSIDLAPELPDALDAADPGSALCDVGPCNDGLDCTLDGCDANGCTHMLAPGFCVIAGACVAADTPGPLCYACVPAVSTTDWSAHTGSDCDDGALCTFGDTCTAGVCIGAVVPCTDEPCHVAAECVPSTGLCQAGAPLPDGESCGPASLCAGGQCLAADVLPIGTVAWFHRTSCPPGWATFAEAIGRTLVPAEPGAAGQTHATPLASGEDRMHSHALTATVSPGSVSFVGIAGCCNGGPAGAGQASIAGEAEPASAELPYVQVLACTKVGMPLPAPVPSWLRVFGPVAGCPAGLAPSDLGAAGRLVVGLPAGGTLGATFGGPDTTATHAHGAAGEFVVNSAGIGLASGCCGGGYASSAALSFSVSTASTAATFPSLRLPLCAGTDATETDALPAGLLVVTAAAECPPGWQSADLANGRLLVGAAAADGVGVSVGTALSDQEDRTHAHPFHASLLLPQKTVSGANGGNTQAAAHGTYATDGLTTPATSQLPFIQLRVCERL